MMFFASLFMATLVLVLFGFNDFLCFVLGLLFVWAIT